MTPIGICVHNTANDASAKNEISYMVNNDLQTSFHFAVDDIEIWQGLPLNRNGWHAGDGVNGDGNRKHIGIEICYSKSGGERFTKAENKAVEFIAFLLNERGWGIDKVKKHQDFSGKYCPHRTLDLGWDRFLNNISNYLKEGGNMSEYEEAIRKAVAYDEVCKLLGQPTTTSAQVTVDKLSKIISDKDRYQRERDEARLERDNYAEEIAKQNREIFLLNEAIRSLNQDFEDCQTQVSEGEGAEIDWEATGRKIIKTTDNVVIETSYKEKG
jgi:N-acetylmuramoyl-L-alanine amidase CwlA